MVIRLLCDLEMVRRVPSRDSARPVVFRCVHLFGKSCVVARAPADGGETCDLLRDYHPVTLLPAPDRLSTVM